MIDVVWLIPALPLAGFLVLAIVGKRLGEPKAGYLATAMAALSFVVTVGVFFDLLSRSHEERSVVKTLFTWMAAGNFKVETGFLVDPLSITMCLFVTGIGSLIHLYAIGYMHGDPKFSKFFVYLNLFVFSMLMLILGSNMLMTFLGWEGVGTCSYFLISFWHTNPANATAGKKAFVTNRIGDFGFMIAMFLTFQHLGSLDYKVLNAGAEGLTKGTATAIALMLFVGACGKSAQLPLFVWLPDAMAGPTPVSALIHAATMVTAGVYLLTRTNVLLHMAPEAATVVAIVGAATALFAATVAVAQNDIKKVLAYSTVSQLGYMFLAVGSGAYVAAIFHMVTHAFFKALLFLGSGSVIHGMHDEQDMRRMGQLRKWMPVTWITFLIGWLAIAGIAPFAGFWSKDEILLGAWNHGGGYRILWAIGLFTAMLTAYYMTRQVIMVFNGEARWNEPTDPAMQAAHAGDAHADDGHGAPAGAHGIVGSAEAHVHPAPHESGPLMLTPLVVLAGLSIVGGLINLPGTGIGHKLEHWLEPVIGESERAVTVSNGTKWALALGTMALCVLAILAAYAVYQWKKAKAVEPTVLANAWYYDKGIAAFMGGPGEKIFEGVATVDAKGVDGAVNGVASLVQGSARFLRRAQNGYVRTYAAGVGMGAVALLGWFVVRGMF